MLRGFSVSGMNKNDNIFSISLLAVGWLFEYLRVIVNSELFSVVLSLLSFISLLLVVIINLPKAFRVIRNFVYYLWCRGIKLRFIIKRLIIRYGVKVFIGRLWRKVLLFVRIYMKK